MRVLRFNPVLAALVVTSASGCSHAPARLPGDPLLHFAGEARLDNLRQLTHDGQNAGGRWSFDGTRLVFQRRSHADECDQTVSVRTDATDPRMLSDRKGRTGGAAFTPGDERVLLSSTSAKDEQCQVEDAGAVPSSYQLYSVKTDGSDWLPLEPAEPRAYNSEPATCKDGSVVFTSDRDGDLELYRGKLDRLGTLVDITRVTRLEGYDGGAAFSPDCSKITWQASRPRDEAEAADDKVLLKQHRYKPRSTEIWAAHADGSDAHQVTRLGAKSTEPTFLPDGDRILFSSNVRDPQGLKSDLYLIHSDGTRMERVSFSEAAENFPALSPDGKTLAFLSSRGGTSPGSSNLLIADWIDGGAPLSLSLADPAPENRFKALVEKLSAPELEGRALGTPGLAKAEALVTDQMTAAGLKPWDGGFAQRVDIATGGRVVVAHNLVGIWGNACKKTPPVVLGAHLDHLGNGGPGSPEPSQQGFHPGADSNASGVAALLEAARLIRTSGISEAKSCFVFAAFTGEESGIAGSSRFVAGLRTAKIRPKAMLNLDMVGRLENSHLTVFGTQSAEEWRALLNPACNDERLRCEEGGDGYGPSDQMAFYEAGVPVLHFFTGPHADYHRTTDTPDKINATGALQVAHIAASVAVSAASPRQRLHFLKALATPAFELPIPGTSAAGHGSYLGTIPDYAALSTPRAAGEPVDPDQGVKLAGTRPGSPASKAGVKSGDVLIGVEMPANSSGQVVTRKIRTLEDFMTTLTLLNPGDAISLHVRRGAKNLSLAAQVGKR